MAKLFHILVILCLIFPSIIHAETNTESVKVAFIKDGYLWLKVNDKKEKLTDKKATYHYSPQWSYDGKMLLYQKEAAPIYENKETSNELWVYEIETKKHRKIFYDGYNPKWSPTENIIAFQSGGVLNISDLKSFYNIALGVDVYEWQPNGKGFITSSGASLRPDGWTNPILYTISIENGYQNIRDLTKNVKTLFVIPKEIGKDDVKILSINAESFAFSPNKKWLSFIVSPTASWSMDSDMLCVISVEGKEFTVIDEVILDFTPKWSFKENLLGYIAGGGRFVYGFKNKDLKVIELPMYQTFNLTPENYAEMGFSWVDDNSLIVSRVKESEWSNDPEKRPKPSLYLVALNDQKQIKITTPSKDEGDYDPIFVPSISKISWLRRSDIISSKSDLWIADLNGDNAKVWIHDVGPYAFYPSR
jgi:hypothetical protein